MSNFLLFVGALIALIVLLANLGPLIVLAISLVLLYVVFIQFSKCRSTAGKVVWIAIGLIVFSIAFTNSYSLFGIVAALALYLIYKKWSENRVVSKSDSTINL